MDALSLRIVRHLVLHQELQALGVVRIHSQGNTAATGSSLRLLPLFLAILTLLLSTTCL
jgi:hypothetical protein